MNKNKELGFTLVELIATIVILGILATIGTVSIVKIRENQSKKFDIVQRDIFAQAAITYYTDNRENLPVSQSRIEKVTLKELQQKKYIGDMLDYYKKPYNSEESTVFVLKEVNGYEYITALIRSDGTPVPHSGEVIE